MHKVETVWQLTFAVILQSPNTCLGGSTCGPNDADCPWLRLHARHLVGAFDSHVIAMIQAQGRRFLSRAVSQAHVTPFALDIRQAVIDSKRNTRIALTVIPCGKRVLPGLSMEQWL